jgi:hypothetical protein
MLCAGLEFWEVRLLTGAASTLEERKTMRPYLGNAACDLDHTGMYHRRS